MDAASDANTDMFHDRSRRCRDDLLFAQPRSSCYGDCPICCLPLPLPHDASCHHATMTSCCSKMICNGCLYVMRKGNEALRYLCPFCRHPFPKTKAECKANVARRMEANEPVAMRIAGQMHYSEGDYDKAFQYWTKSAGQGDAVSHYRLSFMYRYGEGVEKEIKKSIHHWEEAAIAGHLEARFRLGVYEWKRGNKERAVKHWIIASNLGEEKSLKELRQAYVERLLSKEDYNAALRAYQTAVDATKSPQRVLACMNSFMNTMIDFTL